MAITPAGGTAVNYSYTWDNANRRATLTLPNGVTASYSYDGDSRVTKLQYGTSGASSQDLGALIYGYDADGRRINVGGSLAALNLPAAVPQSGTAHNADNEQTIFNGATLSYDLDGNLTGDGLNPAQELSGGAVSASTPI